MSDWVAIQRNPTSGSGPKAKVLRELVRELKRRDIRPRLISRRQQLVELLSKEEQRATLRCIVAAGGDGTVGDVINRHPGVPMTVCPLGTENLFARYLGIPRSGQFVAEMIGAGNKRTLDVCELTATAQSWSGEPPAVELEGSRLTQKFLIMASVGFDACVVHETHARRRGHIRRWSYVGPTLRSWWRYGYPPMRFYVDEEVEPRPGVLALGANLPMYAMRLPVARDAVGDDGLIDLRIFERPARWNMLRYFWKLWWGRHERLPDVISLQARRVRIESDVAVPLQVDGDPAGFTPAEFHVQPGALTIIAPAERD